MLPEEEQVIEELEDEEVSEEEELEEELEDVDAPADGDESVEESADESPDESLPDPEDFIRELGRDVLAERSQRESAAERAEREAAEKKAYEEQFKLKADDFSAEIGAIELPDEIDVNGEKVNLKQIEENAPGAVALTKALAVAISKKLIAHELAGVKEGLQREAFFGELTAYHPDARLISNEPDFQEFEKSAPEEIRALLYDSDVRNVAVALDYYKMQKEKAAKSAEPKAEPKKRKKKRGMYKTSPKETAVKKRGGAYSADDDSPEALDYWWEQANAEKEA